MEANPTDNDTKIGLSIFALGGVFEIGKNMYVVEYGDDLVVIDCGSKFPDESLLGIDLITPDIGYLLQNKDKVRALVITHGHEDHIGGVPYFLKQLRVPVYATRLTLGLIELKLKEHRLKKTELHEITAASELALGKLTLSFFRTNHSIPDCLGIVLDTPVGRVVHTGDFKFDLSPANGQYPEIHKMARIGEEGVLVLLSESTNAERPGFTPSESLVGDKIMEAFQKARHRVFLSTFASNVSRLQQVVDAAIRTERKLALMGRSMVNVVNVALDYGYLTMPEGMLIDVKVASELPRDKVAILCTGSQGEPMAALSRLANGNYAQMDLLPEDTVIFASSPIPGNERSVAAVLDQLYLRGAYVIHGSGSSTGMHVSGHGSQEELKLMLTLMKPAYFVPIHGEYRMLSRHKELAQSVGMDGNDVFLMRNGDVLDVTRHGAEQNRKVTAGNTLIDGLGIGDVGNVVLRDRKHLAEDGILIVVVTLSSDEGTLLSRPEIITRGFVHVKESEALLAELNQRVTADVSELLAGENRKWSVLKHVIRKSCGSLILERTRRRPMILPVIIEV
ncbi:ribonuclease J [Paenibacillus agaridevorans]|uniref:Ribonuclease J n=1 Tax=Paenibacillus agaridevorans TaxID=171404 RepID=A0A2R5ETP1_9BACL|nr:ribonuclease J [Paenibacillus agaridevorans]GBG10040.1 ribonuclease J [Paenibacillus agaridevorans]